MLYVVTPLYTIYSLFTLGLMVIFSNNGLLPFTKQNTLEAATLTNNGLLLSAYFAVAFALVLISVNRNNWKIGGGCIVQSRTSLVFT